MAVYCTASERGDFISYEGQSSYDEFRHLRMLLKFNMISVSLNWHPFEFFESVILIVKINQDKTIKMIAKAFTTDTESTKFANELLIVSLSTSLIY